MRRIVILSLLTTLLVFGAFSALAQKGFQKDPLPFPTDGEGWMALSGDELSAYLQNPGAIQDFAAKVFPYMWEDLQRQFKPQIDAFGGEAGVAWDSTITRVVTVLLGGLLLWFPHRLHVVGWAFIGIVIGVVLVQTNAAGALMTEIFPDEASLQTGIAAVVITIALLGLSAGITLGLFFFVIMSASGWLAGALIGASLFNNGLFDLSSPTVFVPAILFSILMAAAVGRSTKLVAAMIGAALVVAALRLSPSLIPLIGGSALVVSLIRTRYAKSFKREPLQSLTLGEGKVSLTDTSRKHLHGKTPEMDDDSDNSPFKAL